MLLEEDPRPQCWRHALPPPASVGQAGNLPHEMKPARRASEGVLTAASGRSITANRQPFRSMAAADDTGGGFLPAVCEARTAFARRRLLRNPHGVERTPHEHECDRQHEDTDDAGVIRPVA